MFLLLPLLFILFPIFGFTQELTNKVKGISIIKTSIFSPTGTNDSTTIFYYPDGKLIKLSTYYIKKEIKLKNNSEEEVPDEDGINDPSKIIEEGQQITYYYFNLKTKKGISFLRDSIYEKNISLDSFNNIKTIWLDTGMEKNLQKYGQKKIDSTSQYNYIISYVLPHNNPLKYADTTIFYYSKEFVDIDYDLFTSFHYSGLKLQKLRIISVLSPDLSEDINQRRNVFNFTIEIKSPSKISIEDCNAAYQFAKSHL
jgi:hypothetical protein